MEMIETLKMYEKNHELRLIVDETMGMFEAVAKNGLTHNAFQT